MAEAGTTSVPVWAHVHLTHAALQRLANEIDVDLLHVKGPATDASLRAGAHYSTDADVLVRPSHVDRFTTALQKTGWSLFSGFEEGSPFGHAANYTHPSWSFADVHRQLPGPRATPDAVFDRLWRDRLTAEIAHYPCTVLPLAGQVLMQAMHTARSHEDRVTHAWRLADDALRTHVRELASELQATTALAAGIGELDQHRDAPDYALWEYWSRAGGDRLGEWSARLRSAEGLRARARVTVQALRVNRTHLALRLGHKPSFAELAREQFVRFGLALSALRDRMRGTR